MMPGTLTDAISYAASVLSVKLEKYPRYAFHVKYKNEDYTCSEYSVWALIVVDYMRTYHLTKFHGMEIEIDREFYILKKQGM